MKRALPSIRPPERWAAIVFLSASALVAVAAFEPLGGSWDVADHGLSTRPDIAEFGTGGEFLAAPPFDPARRRLTGSELLPVPQTPEALPEPPKQELPMLSGIIANGGTRKALFVGAGEWLGIGATIEGWTVAAIEPRRVILRRMDRQLALDAFRR